MNSVLALGAHPDDLEIFCGATLARLAGSGVSVVGVIATRGEKGTRRPGVDPEDLATTRRAEAEAGARALGLTGLVFLGFPDGELDRHPAELREKLAALYRRHRPQAVFAFDPWRPYEFHPDHRALGWAASDALLAAKLPLYYPEQLATGLKPWDIAEFYLYHTDQPDTWFGVDGTFARKVQAVRAHRSQFSAEELRELEETLGNEARGWGSRAGAEYGEAFKRLVFGELLIFQSLTRRNGEG